MPSGAKIIHLGFGLTGEYSDLDDLLDLGYYTRGFAFFAPAGSLSSGLPVVYPAYKPEVFAVTARKSVWEAEDKAHTGPEVDGIAFSSAFVSGSPNQPLRAYP